MTLREFILLKKMELLEFENYWLEGQLDPTESSMFKKEQSSECWEIEFANWWSTKNIENEIHCTYDKKGKK